jgi:hypothetical protein
VPTDIYFAGANVRITVDADPGQVADAFTAAQGVPFRLAADGGRDEVYVNPATVAFWSASEPGPEPELPDQTPPATTKRGAVTDIWGNPPSRKPRR